MSILHIDINIDPIKVEENNYCDEILHILKMIRPEWFVDEDSISILKVKKFTEGYSNHLFGYYQDGRFKEDVVLIRIDGVGSETVVDRELEKKIIQALHAAGCAQPLYASFNNGIAYRFVDGVTLNENTVKDRAIGRLIAEEIIKVQEVRPDGLEVKSGLWDKMYRYLDQVPDKYDDAEKQKQFVAIVESKEVLKMEVDMLKSHLTGLNSPIVFCHSDLLMNNIVYNEEKERVYFIDFEYATYNYEHFELGNHFAEYAGMEYNFSRCPGKPYQLDWLQYYLQQQAKHRGIDPELITDKDVEICYVKTNKFALAGFMTSGLWALARAKNSLIDFGYLEHAKQRIAEYFRRKEEFFPLSIPS